MRCSTLFALSALCGCGGDKNDGPPPMTSPASAGLVEDMVAIPAGEFLARPIHCVDGRVPSPPPKGALGQRVKHVLGPYVIDRRVATCADYFRCRDAGACTVRRSFCRHDVVGGDVHVSLTGATEYCAWRGAHLIHYAEWQRAVRGIAGLYRPDGRELRTFGEFQDARENDPLFTSPDGVEYDLRGGDELTSDTECDDDGRVGPLVIDSYPLMSAIDVAGPDLEPTGHVRCARELTNAGGAP